MKKILVVEDSKFQAKRISQYLQNEYQVILAENGEQALEILDKEKPDCILSDLLMPVMDGFELLKKIKEKAPLIPISIITSDNQNLTREKCLELGAIHLLTKPFKENDLLELVKKTLR